MSVDSADFLGVDNIVLSHLKKAGLMKSTSKSKMQPRTNKFSVSQVSYDCMRMIYFGMLYPRQAADDKVGTYTIGDIVHNIVQEAFEEKGAKTEVGCGKSYYDNNIRIQGSADIKYNNYAIEVKSVSPFAWKYIVGNKEIIGKPKIQHVRQINTYIDLLELDYGVILYVNKDNFNMKSYLVKKDAEMMDYTVEKCITVWESITNNILPGNSEGNECSRCAYKDLCKGL